ncbi:MAG: hypothetical protein JW839_12640 [Candidatus Lokiarchaeota archaeon]|nr:hypothetical protein [Candidatus Lokiarchaeota archaeon]
MPPIKTPRFAVIFTLFMASVFLPFLTVFFVVFSTTTLDPGVPFDIVLGIEYVLIAVPILSIWLWGHLGGKKQPPCLLNSVELTEENERNLRLLFGFLAVLNILGGFSLGWLLWNQGHHPQGFDRSAQILGFIGTFCLYYFTILAMAFLRLYMANPIRIRLDSE